MIANLKKLREEAGMSQRQLADSIGVSQQSVNKYENHNVEPDIAVLVQIAGIFNTSVDYLIGRTDIRRVIEATYAYDLNDEEKRLIDSFRALNSRQRKSVLLVMDCYNDKL
ncbi:MAG: helix-turn-helix transcriptional regulator [Eubacteriales bacterium]|nr:helix-turn-helix transcriptional regulator [Eubacteriales bacterium]MCI7571171.1 helix-turn-helix transcriptional regulator [Clostridiales bacterium]